MMTNHLFQQITRCAAALSLALATAAFADDHQPTTPGKELESLHQEIQELKEGQGAIQKQLARLRRFKPQTSITY